MNTNLQNYSNHKQNKVKGASFVCEQAEGDYICNLKSLDKFNPNKSSQLYESQCKPTNEIKTRLKRYPSDICDHLIKLYTSPMKCVCKKQYDTVKLIYTPHKCACVNLEDKNENYIYGSNKKKCKYWRSFTQVCHLPPENYNEKTYNPEKENKYTCYLHRRNKNFDNKNILCYNEVQFYRRTLKNNNLIIEAYNKKSANIYVIKEYFNPVIKEPMKLIMDQNPYQMNYLEIASILPVFLLLIIIIIRNFISQRMIGWVYTNFRNF